MGPDEKVDPTTEMIRALTAIQAELEQQRLERQRQEAELAKLKSANAALTLQLESEREMERQRDIRAAEASRPEKPLIKPNGRIRFGGFV